MPTCLKIPVLLSLFFSLNLFAADRTPSVDQNFKLAAIDPTILITAKDGSAQTWKLVFGAGREMVVNLDADGSSSYYFNHGSMCMGDDLGTLAAPFKFATLNDHGERTEVVVDPAKEKQPVHVYAVCPKPGEILELTLNSPASDMLPGPLKTSLQAQLQARITAVAQNVKLMVQAKANGLANHYALIRPGSVCLKNYDGEKDCDYQMVATLTIDQGHPDSDGFLKADYDIGAVRSKELQQLAEYNTANPTNHRTLASARMEARKSPRTAPIHFNEDGTLDLGFGADLLDFSAHDTSPAGSCVLRVKPSADGAKVTMSTVANDACHTPPPYLDLIGASFEMTRDE